MARIESSSTPSEMIKKRLELGLRTRNAYEKQLSYVLGYLTTQRAPASGLPLGHLPSAPRRPPLIPPPFRRPTANTLGANKAEKLAWQPALLTKEKNKINK